MTLFFCNIGWMSEYRSLKGRRDKDNIVNGGSWVTENRRGIEVCNFLPCDDGYVYGHVETIKRDIDRRIRLTRLGGGKRNSVSGVTVIWTATDPQRGGRRVVGWYRNATVFAERQFFPPPSPQHAKDKITHYRIRARSEDAHLLGLDQRSDDLKLDSGRGWMGRTPWWIPNQHSSPDVRRFVSRVETALASERPRAPVSEKNKDQGGKSPSTAADPYTRYVQEHEVKVTPRHKTLQRKFEKFLTLNKFADIQPDIDSVDVRFRDPSRGLVLAEIKPCDLTSARFAIRMAIGQLLDYRQRCPEPASMLIVTERKPADSDQGLALSNGFAVAYPAVGAFRIRWPALTRRARRR